LCLVPCALCLVSCALCLVPCALCLVPCALCLVPCALCLVPCALCLVPCALCLVPCALCLYFVPCASCPVPCALFRWTHFFSARFYRFLSSPSAVGGFPHAGCLRQPPRGDGGHTRASPRLVLLSIIVRLFVLLDLMVLIALPRWLFSTLLRSR
jgi:hypothetical protein